MTLIPNTTTEEGRELGRHFARLCDREMEKRPFMRERCGTCAFREGEHLANGSPATLMTALKCAIEGKPFMCHEGDHPCRGWAVLRATADGKSGNVPWDYAKGE
jgi:hypothetical protein